MEGGKVGQFCRKQYNSEYYLRNKERIREHRLKRKTEIQPSIVESQLSLFEIQRGPQIGQPRSQTFKFEFLGLLTQILLIAGITYFLLREAVEFYQSNNSNLEQSILAALLVEGLLIVFAFLKPSNLLSQILVKTVLALLFLYSSWSFSSNVIGKGMGNIAQGEVLRETISGLKSTMMKNDLAIEVFMQKGWLSAARKLTNENNEHRKSLLELQANEMNQSLRPEQAQKSNTISLVVLRFLFQISNIILVHQLSSGFQRQFRSRRRTMVWRREMDFAAA
jgi:hypothetical protein